MSLSELTDPAAVRAAIDEFRAMGREKFLDKYGFGPARDYFVVDGSDRFDSKAIAGAAHGYQHGHPLGNHDFSGGDATVARRLERLGFTVSRPYSPPDWTTDELILALDLYLRTHATVGYGTGTPEVVELSRTLRELVIFRSSVRENPRFRNAAGVALKLHNFASIDPGHEGQGMPHGGRGDQLVWDAWAHRPAELHDIAIAIVTAGTGPALEDEPDDEDYIGEEGRILTRLSRKHERDRELVRRKRAAVLKKTGRLACEVCDFESGEAYGSDLAGVIDVHHIVPLHIAGVSKPRLSDLALLCPTCHRVVHRHKPVMQPEDLKGRRSGPAD